MAERIDFRGAALAALQAPETGELSVYDERQRGLCLRVMPTARVFYVYKKVGGRPRRIALGPFDARLPETREIPRDADPLDLLGNSPRLNVRMARTLAGAVIAELEAGRDPVAPIRTLRAEATLQEAFELYEERHLVGRARKTTDDIKAQFNRYFGDVNAERKPHGRERKKPPGSVRWIGRRLSEITREDVATLHARIGATGRKMTANRVIEILSAIYGRMIAWHLFEGPNPCAGVEPFAEESRDRFLRTDELPRFFAQLTADPSENFRDFMLLCLFTGARRSNVMAMAWQDIDLSAQHWRIPDTKSGEPVVVPLVTEAVAVLTRRKPQAAGFVFPAESKSGHMSPPKKQWTALLSRAGLADVHLHDLRRSLGSHAAMTGASLPIIGKALGHKDSKSTAIYARLQVDPVREAMQKAVDSMTGADKKKEQRRRRAAKPKQPTSIDGQAA